MNNSTIIGRTLTGEPFEFRAADRRRHFHVIGQTGTGKSVLLQNLIAADLANGSGLALLDPHGDLAIAALAFIPKHRSHHLVYFDPSDLARPIGYNILYGVPVDRRPTVTDDIVAAFVHIWGEISVGSRSQQVLRNSLRALMDAPSTTLLCVPKLLTDTRYRAQILRTIQDPFVRLYWTDQYEAYDNRKRDEVISPLLNKLDAFLSVPAIRNILAQPTSTIDLRRIIDEGRILIVRISKGDIGESNAHLLGALIVTGLANAALSRSDIPEQNRTLFHLYVDEFQSFATDSFALILSEARKYGLALTLGHQFLSQIPEQLRDAVLGNTGSVLAFRLGAEDAPLMASHLGLKNPDALKDLPNFHAWGRFLEHGTPTSPTNLETYPPPQAVNDRTSALIENSRIRFGRHRSSVEDRITRFLGERRTKPHSTSW
jgi:type IV secretory pathway TraG/TraD family ATPase VirD4